MIAALVATGLHLDVSTIGTRFGGIPQGFPDYVLHKMVTVMKDGGEVKISKRAGSYEIGRAHV